MSTRGMRLPTRMQSKGCRKNLQRNINGCRASHADASSTPPHTAASAPICAPPLLLLRHVALTVATFLLVCMFKLAYGRPALGSASTHASDASNARGRGHQSIPSGLVLHVPTTKFDPSVRVER